MNIYVNVKKVSTNNLLYKNNTLFKEKSIYLTEEFGTKFLLFSMACNNFICFFALARVVHFEKIRLLVLRLFIFLETR